MKKLAILIPQYKETDEIIQPLLDSIKMQNGINLNDIEIIICNDGSETLLSEDFLKSYKLPIKYYVCAHKGPAGTRNNCMSYADAEYYMFCDADDCFSDMMALYNIMNCITAKHPDVIISPFYLENILNDKLVFSIIKAEDIHIHGKIFKKSFLEEKNITWEEKLLLHEDTYFTLLALNETMNVATFSSPFYIWKYYKNSITRSADDVYEQSIKVIDSAIMLIEEFKRRELEEAARSYIAGTIYYIYKIYGQIKKPHKTLIEFYNRYKIDYDALDREEKEYLVKRYTQDSLEKIEKWMGIENE